MTSIQVEGQKIESCKQPDGNPGAKEVAMEVISTLDKEYTREQVHAIARWVLYLSTQA